MSVLFTEEEVQQTIEFLRRFVALRPDAFGEDEPLPFRVTPLSISINELEGESIEWCTQYLDKSGAPEAVAALITRAAINKISAKDLSIYKQDEGEDALLDSSRIARDAINKVIEVCRQWNSEPPSFQKSKMKYESCVHAIKNTRRKMEDRHVILPEFNSLFGFPQDCSNQAFFAVYDGHSGVDASNFSATHLHCHLARNKNLATDPRLALKEAFEETDECFVAKAKREGLRSGSTGVAVFIKGESLYVAWLGDSQVVLCKAGQHHLLMDPHKPNREDERQRIEALGGCVVFFGAWRVNGSLSVSRAIGDAEHKPYISGEPDTEELDLEGDEDFLILACDGLWDVIKPSEAVNAVCQYLAEGGDRASVAKCLVDGAKDAGSNDNISVVVVFLDSHKKDVCEQEVCDSVSRLSSSSADQHVSFTKNGSNSSENGTNQETNCGDLGEKSSAVPCKLSQKSLKKSCEPSSKSAEDGGPIKGENSPMT